MTLQPLYLFENCSVAYQLNWSLSVFGRTPLPLAEDTLDELRAALAPDGLKILEYRPLSPKVAQFFVSSRPEHSPSSIVRLVKGRWQYIARKIQAIDWARNYHIVSVGSAKGSVLDAYVARQSAKHPMADPQVQKLLESLQYSNPKVEPTALRRSAYGEFTHALQVVLQSDAGWHEARVDVLRGYRDMILGACLKHNWLLSRMGLLSNHMHVLLSAGIDESPSDIALCLLNNLASTQAMKPIFKFSYYVGTFGEYDRGVIWNEYQNRVLESKEAFAL